MSGGHINHDSETQPGLPYHYDWAARAHLWLQDKNLKDF